MEDLVPAAAERASSEVVAAPAAEGLGALLTTEEAASRLRVHAATVRRWRLDGVGPRYLRVGSVYRYPAVQLEGWIAGSLRGEVAS